MIKYKKVYLKYFGYGEQDYIPCEVCGFEAVDVHHIYPKGMGGSKTKDNIENLMGLCRTCHTEAHDEQISKEELQRIHNTHLK